MSDSSIHNLPQHIAAEYPFHLRRHDVDGHSLNVVDQGEGPVLLFVHGNPTWSFAFRKLIAGLSADHRCVAIDHLGCGLSDKPQDGDYTLTGHVRRLISLIEALDLQNVTLIGHDWGGAIGMGAATRVPDRFSRFVLMNTAAFLSQRIPLRISVCRIPLLGKLAILGFNAFSAAAVKMAVEKPLDSTARDGLLWPYDSWRHRRAVYEFVQDIPLKPSHRSYAELQRIDASIGRFQERPILLPWGMRDWCFTPAFYAEFRKRFPNAETFPIDNAGHYIFEDAPDALLKRIQEFLLRTDQ